MTLSPRRSVAWVVSDGRGAPLRACFTLEQVAGERAAELGEPGRLHILEDAEDRVALLSGERDERGIDGEARRGRAGNGDGVGLAVGEQGRDEVARVLGDRDAEQPDHERLGRIAARLLEPFEQLFSRVQGAEDCADLRVVFEQAAGPGGGNLLAQLGDFRVKLVEHVSHFARPPGRASSRAVLLGRNNVEWRSQGAVLPPLEQVA